MKTGFVSPNFSLKQSPSVCHEADFILRVIPPKKSSWSSRQVFWEELDPESAGLLSFLLLYPFILWFPLLLRHFSTEVKSGLVSLLDTETQKNREKEVLEWAHEHTGLVFAHFSEFLWICSLSFCSEQRIDSHVCSWRQFNEPKADLAGQNLLIFSILSSSFLFECHWVFCPARVYQCSWPFRPTDMLILSVIFKNQSSENMSTFKLQIYNHESISPVPSKS